MEDKIIDTIKDIGNKLNEEYLRAGTKSKRRRILYELFINNFYMNVICMKDKIEDNDDCVYIEEERIKKYADNIMTRSNFYDMYYYTEGLDSKYSFIYPIGQFMAIYLYENYKQDKENFIEEFKRSFLIYPTNPTIEAFNKVGINYQELKEGKVLKRILNEYKTKF